MLPKLVHMHIDIKHAYRCFHKAYLHTYMYIHMHKLHKYAHTHMLTSHSCILAHAYINVQYAYTPIDGWVHIGYAYYIKHIHTFINTRPYMQTYLYIRACIHVHQAYVHIPTYCIPYVQTYMGMYIFVHTNTYLKMKNSIRGILISGFSSNVARPSPARLKSCCECIHAHANTHNLS